MLCKALCQAQAKECPSVKRVFYKLAGSYISRRESLTGKKHPKPISSGLKRLLSNRKVVYLACTIFFTCCAFR